MREVESPKSKVAREEEVGSCAANKPESFASFEIRSLNPSALRLRAGASGHNRNTIFRFQRRPRSNHGSRAFPRCIALVLRGVLALLFFVFLVVVGLDDVPDHGPGSFATMLPAFLDEHGDDDFGVAARRVTDKPGIVFQLLRFPHARAGVVADDLRGSGLAAELNPGEPQLATSATAFVDDAVHGIGYFFHCGFGN